MPIPTSPLSSLKSNPTHPLEPYSKLTSSVNASQNSPDTTGYSAPKVFHSCHQDNTHHIVIMIYQLTLIKHVLMWPAPRYGLPPAALIHGSWQPSRGGAADNLPPPPVPGCEHSQFMNHICLTHLHITNTSLKVGT